MPSPEYGLPVSIDGIAPSPPALTLAGAARSIPPEGDRWISGVGIWPYPRDLPDVFDPCQPSSSAGHTKDAGTPTQEERFGAYNVLEGITCTTRSFGSNQVGEWQRRAQVALNAYQHWAIEREFWTGALKPDNPHLAQTQNTIPGGNPALPTTSLNGGNATSIKNAIALLEQQIADKGGNGVIHLRPAVFSQFAEQEGAVSITNGVARTKLGTILVPGVGYVGSAPDGTLPATTVEWAYATGPVEIRKSEVKVLPETVSQATDRRQNTTTFRAELYALVTWDQRIHVAVKIDRSFTTFTS